MITIWKVDNQCPFDILHNLFVVVGIRIVTLLFVMLVMTSVFDELLKHL
jgi:hypothetical protein